MYIKQSVPRAAGNPGIGINTRDALTLIDVDDIAFMPPRDDKGVLIAEDIILKAGRYGYTIYMTPGTVEVTSAAEGETRSVSSPRSSSTTPATSCPCASLRPTA